MHELFYKKEARKFILLFGVFLLTGILMSQAGIVQAAPLQSLKDSFVFVETLRGKAGVKEIKDAPSFIEEVLTIGMTLVAIIALAVFIYGGFLYITSAGEEEQAKKAKKLVIYAILGLLLIGAAAIIVNIVIGIYKKP